MKVIDFHNLTRVRLIFVPDSFDQILYWNIPVHYYHHTEHWSEPLKTFVSCLSPNSVNCPYCEHQEAKNIRLYLVAELVLKRDNIVINRSEEVTYELAFLGVAEKYFGGFAGKMLDLIDISPYFEVDINTNEFKRVPETVKRFPKLKATIELAVKDLEDNGRLNNLPWEFDMYRPEHLQNAMRRARRIWPTSTDPSQSTQDEEPPF